MATFNASYDGIGELLRSPAMEAEMRRRAEKALAFAVADAPFDPHSTDGTHYKTSFKVESSREGGIHHDRAEARLVNDDAAAFYIEYGTATIRKHRVLGRAMDSMRE